MEVYFKIIGNIALYGIGLVFVFLAIGWLFDNYNKMKKHKEAGGTFKPQPQVAPTVVNDLWTKIHNDIGISMATKKLVPKIAPEEDGSIGVGSSIEETIYYPPKYELKENGILLKYPDKTGAKTQNLDFLRRIADDYAGALFKNGLIPYPKLYPEACLKPDEIFFKFITPENEVELKLYNITDRHKLFKTNPMGQTVRPKIYFDGDDLLFDTTDCALSKEEITKACVELSVAFTKNFQTVEQEETFLYRMPHIRPKKLAFKPKKGEAVLGSIYPNMDKVEKVRSILKDLEDKTGTRWAFMGETIDPVVKISSKYISPLGDDGEEGIFVPLKDLIHIRLSGMTGSGKSSTLVSFFYFNTNRDDIIILGDGDKEGSDFLALAETQSPLPIIKKDFELPDHMILFGNAFDYIWREYHNRKRIIGKAGCKDIHDYNKENPDKKIPWMFLLIDEFIHFKKEVGMSDSGDTNGGMGGKLEKLLSGARAYGVMVVLASQGAYVDTYPTNLARNLPTVIVHNLESNERSKFPELGDINLGPGEYLIKINGVNCQRTGKNMIKATMPYVGDSKTIRKIFEEKNKDGFKEKIAIDYDLLVPKGDENFEESKVGPKELWKYIKKLFMKEQGFKVDNLIADNRITEVHFCAIVEDMGNETHPKEFEGKILFGLLDNNYDISEVLFKKPSNKAIIEKHKPHLILLFTTFEIKKKDVEVLKKEGFLPNNCVLIPRSLYAKDLTKALGDYEERDFNDSFREILRDVWIDFEADETQERVDEENQLEAKLAKIENRPVRSDLSKKARSLPTLPDEVDMAKAKQELFRQRIKEHLAKRMKNSSPVEQRTTNEILKLDEEEKKES